MKLKQFNVGITTLFLLATLVSYTEKEENLPENPISVPSATTDITSDIIKESQPDTTLDSPFLTDNVAIGSEYPYEAELHAKTVMSFYVLAYNTAKELKEYPEGTIFTWHTQAEGNILQFTITGESDDFSESEFYEVVETYGSYELLGEFMSDWAKIQEFTLIFGENSQGEPAPYTTSPHWASLGIPRSVEETVTGETAEFMAEYLELEETSSYQEDVTVAYNLVLTTKSILNDTPETPIGTKITWKRGESAVPEVDCHNVEVKKKLEVIIGTIPAAVSEFGKENPFVLEVKTDSEGNLTVSTSSDLWAKILNMPTV